MPLPQIQVLRNFQKRGQLGTSLWDKIYHGGVAVGEQVYLLSPLAVHLKPTTEVCNPPNQGSEDGRKEALPRTQSKRWADCAMRSVLVRGPWKGGHKSELVACPCDKGGLDSRPPKEFPFNSI